MESKFKLFDELINAAMVNWGFTLQSGDQILALENETLEELYKVLGTNHEQFQNFSGLKDILENHVIDKLSDTTIQMVSGAIFPYVPNKSVDGIELHEEYDLNGMVYIPFDGVLLTDKDNDAIEKYIKPKLYGDLYRKMMGLDNLKTQFFHLRMQPTVTRFNLNTDRLPFWSIVMEKQLDELRKGYKILDAKFEDLPELPYDIINTLEIISRGESVSKSSEELNKIFQEAQKYHKINFNNFQVLREIVLFLDKGLTDIMGKENRKVFEKKVTEVFGGDNFSEMTEAEKLLYSDKDLEKYRI